MRPTMKKRKGITLIDVTLAAVIMSMGTIFLATYFTNVYDQLSPRGNTGLRRYLLAEQMLKAQAEALRVFNPMPSVAAVKVITEPAGFGYSLGITRFPVSPAEAGEELLFHDLTMTHTVAGGTPQTIGTLSVSTLRSTNGGLDEKIGL